jgi:hypothetical protein
MYEHLLVSGFVVPLFAAETSNLAREFTDLIPNTPVEHELLPEQATSIRECEVPSSHSENITMFTENFGVPD